MIIRERETKNKIKAKGTVVKIDMNGIHIEDEKTGIIDTLKFGDLNMFVGKVVNFNIADSEKEDIEKE